VVLADVQAGKQPARKAEPAKYAGRDERAGHVVRHWCPWKPAALQARCV